MEIRRPADDAATVPCSQPHTAETFAVGRLPDRLAGIAGMADEIDDSAIGGHLFATCEKRFREYLGGDESAVMRSTMTWSWFRPSRSAWEAGARWWRCDVIGGGEESTELMALPPTTKDALLGRPRDRWVACVDGPSVTNAEKIPCNRPHTWRAVTTIVVGEDDAAYPGDDVVSARTRDFCSDSVGAWLDYPVDYDFAYTYFHEAEWEAGNRRSVCWARTAR